MQEVFQTNLHSKHLHVTLRNAPQNGPSLEMSSEGEEGPVPLFTKTTVLLQQIALFQCVSLYSKVLLNGSHTS